MCLGMQFVESAFFRLLMSKELNLLSSKTFSEKL